MSDRFPNQHAAQTHLQQIIAALTEGIILVDLDGKLAWADETALTLHEVRGVKELGATAAGYKARFKLSYLNGHELGADEYPMQQLLDGRAIDRALIEVVRRADGKRWVHDVRTMVLKDHANEPDSLVVILKDETERFNAEERFERAFGANPAPAIIVRLGDLRYVKVNHGFLELTGFTPSALIGHSMHEIDLLRGAEKRELAVRRLHAGETIPQMEGSLLLADGKEKTVLLGGQPIEIGDEACMLFTFADLHPRQQAQEALRHSEEKFAKAFHMAPGPMVMLSLTGLRVLDVNAAFTGATGWRREEIVGRDEAELEIWARGPQHDEFARHIRHTGRVGSADIQLRSKTGGLRDCLVSADTVEIHGERCVLCVMQDISARKRTETELMQAVQSVMQDTSWLGQKIVEKLADLSEATGGSKQPELDALPARPRAVLELMADGLGDDEIAAKLNISRNTLRNHIAAIYGKLGVRKRGAVIVWARKRGLGSAAQSPVKPAKNLPEKTRVVQTSPRTSRKRS